LLRYFCVALLTLSLLGCAKTPITPLHVKSLEQTLKSIDNLVTKSDAQKLSSKMLYHSKKLKKEYGFVNPPLFHNFLVNTGVKQRGLCWHFAYDMLAHAKSLNLDSFDYFIGGANIGDYWKEHSVLVVTCRGCSFSKGVVIDPWRNHAGLYYSFLKDDKEYIWTQRGGLR